MLLFVVLYLLKITACRFWHLEVECPCSYTTRNPYGRRVYVKRIITQALYQVWRNSRTIFPWCIQLKNEETSLFETPANYTLRIIVSCVSYIKTSVFLLPCRLGVLWRWDVCFESHLRRWCMSLFVCCGILSTEFYTENRKDSQF
jgi:hypothetical protein